MNALLSLKAFLVVTAACSAVACGNAGDGTSDHGAHGGRNGGGSSGFGNGGTPDDSGADGSIADGSTAGGVRLIANGSEQLSSLGLLAAGAGQVYVVVDLVLTNGGIVPLSLTPELFAVTTSSGLRYQGTEDAGGPSSACDGSASLVPGHDVECTVAFLVPKDTTTSTLSYQLPSGSSVTTPLTTPACARCEGSCVDVQTDPKNCGACGLSCPASGGVATCSGGHCGTKQFAVPGQTCTDACSPLTCSKAVASYKGGCAISFLSPISCDDSIAFGTAPPPGAGSMAGCDYRYSDTECTCVGSR